MVTCSGMCDRLNIIKAHMTPCDGHTVNIPSDGEYSQVEAHRGKNWVFTLRHKPPSTANPGYSYRNTMISAQATQANRRDRNTLETDNAPESKGARTDGEVQADQPKARALLPLKGAGLFVPERGQRACIVSCKEYGSRLLLCREGA